MDEVFFQKDGPPSLYQASRCPLCYTTQWVGVSSGVPKTILRFTLVTQYSRNSGKLLYSGLQFIMLKV